MQQKNGFLPLSPWILLIIGLAVQPSYGESNKQNRYQIFPQAVVVSDPNRQTTADLDSSNFGRLGDYAYSLNGTGFYNLKATNFKLARDRFSQRYVLLSGKISIKYRDSANAQQLANDYDLSISSDFTDIQWVYVQIPYLETVYDLLKRLLQDNRVIKAELDILNFHQLQ